MSTETHSNRIFYVVWSALLIFTIVEVVLAYRQLSVAIMLAVLLGLSLLKAGLIVAYFMHLRFEKLSLTLTLIPAVVICIALLGIFFIDSVRIITLGT